MTQLATTVGAVFGERLQIPSQTPARKKGGKPREIPLSQPVESNEPRVGQVFQNVLFKNCVNGRWCAHLEYRGREIQLVVMNPKRRLSNDGECLNVEVEGSIGGGRHASPFMWTVNLLA